MPPECRSEALANSVGEIVNRTKVLAERLRLAIMHQDNLTKDCFETSPTELSETVESVKKRFAKLEQEHQGITEEVKAGETRLNNLLQEYQDAIDENALLKDGECGLLQKNNESEDIYKTANELTSKLRLYKKITGVRFDPVSSNDPISGYVAIQGGESCKSTLIPFEEERNIRNEDFLWQKIGEACEEVTNED